MSQTYSAVIADDEPLLRRYFKELLQDLWPELDVIASVSNGEQAWDEIIEHTPDLVFLDIKMPVLDGISLARRFIELKRAPLTVFVTAFDQHAIDAFENDAIDYLLKPIEEQRLEKTIFRLKERLHSKQLISESELEDREQLRLQKLLSLMSEDDINKKHRLKWVKASKQGALHMLEVSDIHYFLADSKYTSIKIFDDEFLIKTSIVKLEQQLDPSSFWRIHRNCIVNVGQIKKVEIDINGHMFVRLKNSQTKLAVSRSYKSLFKQM